MDEQEGGLTPDELDHLLSDLQTGEEITQPNSPQDVLFLSQLVNTARSTKLHSSFSARLDVQIRQALNRRPLPRAVRSALPRSLLSMHISTYAWPATSLFRYVTVTLASATLLISFIILNTVTWTSSGPGMSTTTFAPSLSDNSLVLLSEHTIASQDVLATGIANVANKDFKVTTQSATMATLTLRAIQAPSPASTPIPGSFERDRFTATPLR